MKKTNFILILFLLLTVLCATGCGHEHTEVIDPAVAPTCTQDGKGQGSHCGECGAILVAQPVVSKLGHNEVSIPQIAPTCTEVGKTEGKKCTICGEITVSQMDIPATGHFAVPMTDVAATCTTVGKTGGTQCSVCKEVLTAQTDVPMIAHTYTETITTEATCQIQGVKTLTCSVCTHAVTENFEARKYAPTELCDYLSPAVVEIYTYDASGEGLGLGSGFVYSQDGKIVTNYHVIEGASSAVVMLAGKEYRVEKVLAYDVFVDLAVLKINATNLTMVPTCDKTLPTGSTVYAFGSSRGLTATLSNGIVTHADRELDGVIYVQHNAAISPGNSGGPLVNEYGEIVGINTFHLVESQNLNFAISVKELSGLDYSKPMTVEEVRKEECDAYETVVELLMEYGTYSYLFNCYELVLGTEYENGELRSKRTVEYYANDGNLDITHYYYKEDGFVCLLYISMYDSEGVYKWTYMDSNDYEMSGTLNAAAFSYSSTLTYSESNTTVNAIILNNATLLTRWMLEDFNSDFEPFGVTADDFGFVNF